jgi:C-8 sterol isomerase
VSYIFDPNVLQDIVKKNLNLPLEERLDAIITGIDKTYPKRICTKKKWAFTIAGGVAGQLTLLYGSLSEYLLIVGFPVGTEGYSGRFAPLIYDVIIEGEHQTYTLGQIRPTVYQPGDMATLPRGTDKGCLMKPGNWLLEYARGFIAQAMPMGILASSITTMDYRSVRRQFWEYSKICTREILRGHLF